MDTTLRKNNSLAAYSYLASLTLYSLPTICLFVNPIGDIPAPFILLLMFALFLGFLVAVGIALLLDTTHHLQLSNS
jgi:hypothetical protein